MKRIFNPENYDIVPCSLCKNSDGFSACTKCGGLGFIMKEKQTPKIRKKSTRPRREVRPPY